MDSSDWLQGTIHDESGLDSSSPSGGDILTCGRPLIERRLRPPHDQAIKCPRCESTHTKFCYYNNYSLTQPRYFCKTCRRYWTKGGTLRNIPVGGGCRKNKKVATNNNNNKKSSNDHHHQSITINNVNPSSSIHHNPADLHLLFPEMHLSHLNNITNFMENPIRAPIDFMESKFEAIVNGSSRNNNNYDFMGSNNNNGEFGMIGGLGVGVGDHLGHGVGVTPNFHGICSPYGIDGNFGGGFAADCQRMMLPYDHSNEDNLHQQGFDVKPNTKMLSLEWQDQRCSDAGKDHSYGSSYMNNLGSWTGMMN